MSFLCLSQKCDTLKTNTVWYLSRYQTGHSLVSEDVSILVGIEGQFEDAIHNAALDGHLGVLQLLLASVLPNSIRSHGAVQVPQKIFHCCRFVIRCRAPLECWRDKDHWYICRAVNYLFRSELNIERQILSDDLLWCSSLTHSLVSIPITENWIVMTCVNIYYNPMTISSYHVTESQNCKRFDSSSL